MAEIESYFYFNGINYENVTDEQKMIVNATIENLKKDQIDFILSTFDNRHFNIVDNDPEYRLLFESDLPEDLCGKVIKAYVNSRYK